MASPEFKHWRAKVGGLVRDRGEGDAELAEARRKMNEEAFVSAVAAAVAKAPNPMTDEVRDRVIGLLS